MHYLPTSTVYFFSSQNTILTNNVQLQDLMFLEALVAHISYSEFLSSDPQYSQNDSS